MCELHPEHARGAARTAIGYSQAFDGKGIDWQNDQPWPHRIELAQALDWITELSALVLNMADRVESRDSEITRLRADLAASQAECERLRADAERLSELLPGPFYMDPPDGGDVPVMEQLRRMAEDAARFRWLTEDHADRGTRARCREILESMPVRSYSAVIAAIDAARAGKGE